MKTKQVLSKLLSILALTSAMGCNFNYPQTYNLSIVGNVFDEQGTPLSGVTGTLCWMMGFSQGDVVEECQPVSTNGEGQFSTMAFATIDTETGDYNSSLAGYTIHLEVGGTQYSGKEIVSNLQSHSTTSHFDGTVVVNYTLPNDAAPEASASEEVSPSGDGGI